MMGRTPAYDRGTGCAADGDRHVPVHRHRGIDRVLEALGETYRSAQDRHDEVMRAAITAEDGHVVRTAGDSFS
jgi:hypothetical protein